MIEIQSEAGFSCCFPRLLRIASFASFFLVFSQACNILQARCRKLAVQKLDPLSSFHSKKYVFLGFQFVFLFSFSYALLFPDSWLQNPKLSNQYIYIVTRIDFQQCPTEPFFCLKNHISGHLLKYVLRLYFLAPGPKPFK